MFLFLKEILKKITKYIFSIKINIDNIKCDKNPYNYEDLTPTDSADDDQHYSNAIHWGLENHNVKNIALTGPYGSGKSSILKTFIKRYQSYSYLNISLGSYKSEIDGQDNISAYVEKSILQQIFYHVEKKTIPHSRFKRIKNIKFSTNLLNSALISLWISVGFILTEKGENLLVKSYPSYEEISREMTILFEILFFIGFILSVNFVIKFLKEKKLEKLNIASGELEFKEFQDESILNKHIDEILYFFEMTKFNVVIIEDLDRFGDVDIFVKLREINTLINNSESIKRKIVFIYAVKDDLFSEECRTKFFDFIIPVIPVVNASNSNDILSKKLNKNLFIIDSNFISDITLYINDMRMLKNIYNEFVLYHLKLKSVSGIDYRLDKLMGFIVYKNKYPTDFALLNEDKGWIAKIFEEKNKIISSLTDNLNNKKNKLENDLQKINQEIANSVDELRKIYLGTILQKIPNLYQFHFTNNRIDYSTILSDEWFHTLQASKNIEYYPPNSHYMVNSGLSFVGIEQEVSKTTYAEREVIVTKKQSLEIDEVKSEIEDLTNLIRDINSFSIKTLIQKFPNHQFIPEEISSNQLIVYLIRKGYIDEMYHTFISFFYEGSLTKNDLDFLLSVKNIDPKKYEHKLKNITEIFNKINIEDYKNIAIWNHDYINYLISYHPNSISTREFINCLKENSSKSIDFIDSYVSKYGELSKDFIVLICENWKSFWIAIQTQQFSNDKFNTYLQMILDNIEDNIVLDLNYGNEISRYISNSNFLVYANNSKDINKILSILLKLEVRLKDVNDIYNTQFINDIYKYSLYEINLNNLESLAVNFGSIDLNHPDFYSSNLTLLKSTNCQELIDNINDNINFYISNVLSRLKENINESLETILFIANHEAVELDNKISFISTQNNKILSLESINDSENWKSFLSKNTLNTHWDNVLQYFILTKEIDDPLLNYLNDNEVAKQLSENPLVINSKLDKDTQKLCTTILTTDKISDLQYSFLAKGIPYLWPSIITFSKLPSSKLQSVIVQKKLKFTIENFSFINSNHPELSFDFILCDIKSAFSEINSLPITETCLTSLLSSNSINISYKIQLINLLDINLVLNANLKSNNAFFNFISDQKLPKIDPSKLLSLLSLQIDINMKIPLFMSQLQYMSNSEIPSYLASFGEPLSQLLKREPCLISKNNLNQKFGKKLIEIGLASSMRTIGNNIKLRP